MFQDLLVIFKDEVAKEPETTLVKSDKRWYVRTVELL
jgi:hypothetical protein